MKFSPSAIAVMIASLLAGDVAKAQPFDVGRLGVGTRASDDDRSGELFLSGDYVSCVRPISLKFMERCAKASDIPMPSTWPPAPATTGDSRPHRDRSAAYRNEVAAQGQHILRVADRELILGRVIALSDNLHSAITGAMPATPRLDGFPVVVDLKTVQAAWDPLFEIERNFDPATALPLTPALSMEYQGAVRAHLAITVPRIGAAGTTAERVSDRFRAWLARVSPAQLDKDREMVRRTQGAARAAIDATQAGWRADREVLRRRLVETKHVLAEEDMFLVTEHSNLRSERILIEAERLTLESDSRNVEHLEESARNRDIDADAAWAKADALDDELVVAEDGVGRADARVEAALAAVTSQRFVCRYGHPDLASCSHRSEHDAYARQCAALQRELESAIETASQARSEWIGAHRLTLEARQHAFRLQEEAMRALAQATEAGVQLTLRTQAWNLMDVKNHVASQLNAAERSAHQQDAARVAEIEASIRLPE